MSRASSSSPVNATLGVSAVVEGEGAFKAEAFYDGRLVGSFEKTAAGFVSGDIKLSETHLWEVGCGRLYDLKITFGADEISSYFGLRDIRIDGYKVLINGKSVFQRLVLDQGFYADGIYTAPSDEALEKDIRLSLAVGFNGARLHQKVFEPRFLYHCDRLGYIVWGEFGNWGLDYSRDGALEAMLPQWCESVARDFNHPAIVGWCPFNETWDRDGRKQNDELLRIIYRVTKQLDETRPCIDTSGNFHVETDIFDVHDYEQKVEIFKGNYDRLMTEGVLFEHFPDRQEYDGKKPAFVSEYGGIQWSLGSRGDAWGYGNAPKSEQEFIDRYKPLAEYLAARGILVTGHDHLGHGGSIRTKADYGYFAQPDGNRAVLADLHAVTVLTKELYPNLPYFLLGHSMGSFVAREYIVKYSDIDGAVICGTSAGNLPLRLARGIAAFLVRVRGERHVSKALASLSFGGFNRRFEKEKDRDSWLCSDPEVRKRYRADRLCDFTFSVSAYRELFTMLADISDGWAVKVPQSLPLFLIAGDSDPLGENGEGIKEVFARLEDAELCSLKMKLYPDGRHEILNDVMKNTVYADIIDWVREVSEGVYACRGAGIPGNGVMQ